MGFGFHKIGPTKLFTQHILTFRRIAFRRHELAFRRIGFRRIGFQRIHAKCACCSARVGQRGFATHAHAVALPRMQRARKGRGRRKLQDDRAGPQYKR